MVIFSELAEAGLERSTESEEQRLKTDGNVTVWSVTLLKAHRS